MPVLPRPTLPLDPVIRDALEDAQRPERIAAMMRLAVREIIYEDLKEEIRAILAEHLE
jgi:hypothetical protein